MGEMACQEMVEVVTEYLEGTLLESDRLRFEAHLAICVYCRIYLDQMKLTIGSLGRLTNVVISNVEKQALVRLFRGWRGAA
jgi:anti-sigma factor RsiW